MDLIPHVVAVVHVFECRCATAPEKLLKAICEEAIGLQIRLIHRPTCAALT